MPFDNLPEREPSREVQLLLRARNRIGSRQRWVQGKWMTPDGRMCMVMAVQGVCADIKQRAERRRMIRRLLRRLDRETPLRRRIILCWLSSRQRLICYNDKRLTTHPQVLGVFHRAIERLEWQEMTTGVISKGLYPG